MKTSKATYQDRKLVRGFQAHVYKVHQLASSLDHPKFPKKTCKRVREAPALEQSYMVRGDSARYDKGLGGANAVAMATSTSSFTWLHRKSLCLKGAAQAGGVESSTAWLTSSLPPRGAPTGELAVLHNITTLVDSRCGLLKGRAFSSGTRILACETVVSEDKIPWSSSVEGWTRRRVEVAGLPLSQRNLARAACHFHAPAEEG